MFQHDTEIYVIESMMSFIDKGFVLYENKPDSFKDEYIFQEAKIIESSNKNDANAKRNILDEVKHREKSDNNKLISIIKFIPRIIIAFCKSMANKFSDSKLGKKIKDLSDHLNKNQSSFSKQIKVNQINNEFKGQFQCYVDEKSGKVKFKKDDESENFITKLINLDNTVADISDLTKEIQKDFDPTNPSKTRSLIVKCNKILKGDKTVNIDDIIDDGIGAIGEVFSNCVDATKILSNMGNNIQYQFQKLYASEKLKNIPDKQKLESLKNCEELSNKITQIISNTNKGMSFISSPLIRNLNRLSDLFNRSKEMDEDLDQYTVDNILEQQFKDTDFKSKYPISIGESEKAYEKRLDDLKRHAAIKFTETPEGLAMWKNIQETITGEKLKEWKLKKNKDAYEQALAEEKIIRK